MANTTGAKWTKGGKLSRKKFLAIDFSNFDAYAEELESLGADLNEIFSKAIEEAADQVQADVMDAIQDANLPAKGAYHSRDRDTENSVIQDPKPQSNGSIISVELGFDKTRPGAGGFLITGTPRMAPDQKLADIFQKKSYERKIKNMINERLQAEIDKRIGG